ncbi:DUF3943 domain-containing protein [Pedobacter nyackensis]|uniref:DUF3943 domain-containing protein n=1 Tax=Pedobacter nyackensis TaxID=475255 RepID=A0A1W2DCB7_9SPHI|nr:DUF3943 domain-containing protein [Pedobacter nyackensis]SMC95013.1 protein of unknown function [Pedobacter nyackensis]
MENSIGYKLLLIILLLVPDSLFAQTPLYRYRQQINQDSLVLPSPNDTLPKKRFYRGAGLLLATNLAPWVYDRYIMKEDFARVSLNTFRYNLNPGHWAWDNDRFITNQFSHPMHGSIAFNTFRSNGYSFLQSIPASFAGSYMWETFAERQAPSINDFVNASFGGIIIGEMAHRLSGKLVNNRSTGVKRQVNEVLACLINPISGFNRIVDGKWGKVPSGSFGVDSSKAYAEFDVGFRNYSLTNRNSNFGWSGRLKVRYGSPFEKCKIPFSFFSLNSEFGKDHTNQFSMINVSGSIRGWPLYSTEHTRHSGRLTANFDYHNLEDFFYGAQSVNLNLYSSYSYSDKFQVNTVLGAGPVLLGALPDPYIYNDRSYGYCSGAGVNVGADISFGKHLFYRFNYRGGWFKTWNGNASGYALNIITNELGANLNQHFIIYGEPGFYSFDGNFKIEKDINRTYRYLKFGLRYGFSF